MHNVAQIKEDAIAKKYERSALRLLRNLQRRNFEAFFCRNKAEALEKAMSLIEEGSSVSWGGSVTIQEIGLIDRLYELESKFTLIDRDKAGSVAERFAIMRQSLLCDTYLTSVNAISEDGVFVNIDNLGNRVAAIAFGPRSVIAIVGMNKLCKTLEDARTRARTYAAPINNLRFFGDSDLPDAEKTPCTLTGICGDCKSDACICSTIVETRMCKRPKRIKIILVGESLGF